MIWLKNMQLHDYRLTVTERKQQQLGLCISIADMADNKQVNIQTLEQL